MIAGDPAACVEGLAGFAEIGCTHAIVSLVRRPGDPPGPHLEAVAESVLPALRAI